MLRFQQYLLEYLTPEQEKDFSQHKMSKKARADTDHFFGKGSDKVHDTNGFVSATAKNRLKDMDK